MSFSSWEHSLGGSPNAPHPGSSLLVLPSLTNMGPFQGGPGGTGAAQLPTLLSGAFPRFRAAEGAGANGLLIASGRCREGIDLPVEAFKVLRETAPPKEPQV